MSEEPGGGSCEQSSSEFPCFALGGGPGVYIFFPFLPSFSLSFFLRIFGLLFFSGWVVLENFSTYFVFARVSDVCVRQASGLVILALNSEVLHAPLVSGGISSSCSPFQV